MIKILSKKKYDELMAHCKRLDNDKLLMEAELTIQETWVEIGDKKLEKAMLRIENLLIIKHEHKSCQK